MSTPSQHKLSLKASYSTALTTDEVYRVSHLPILGHIHGLSGVHRRMDTTLYFLDNIL